MMHEHEHGPQTSAGFRLMALSFRRPSVMSVAGGAIMPDGTVGLILDIAGLVRIAHTA